MINKYKIEKMVYGGNSLARSGEYTVFIENGCTGDIVEAETIKKTKNYAVAKINEIMEPSEYRINPICPLHNVCGSCGWQHIGYKRQLKEKQNIVKETIKNITGKDYNVEQTIPSPKIKEYRCKVQLPVSQTKVSKRILTGYFKKNSHELINIKYCPMQSDLINEITAFIKEEAQKLNITGYDEKHHTGLLRHIIIRQSSNLNNILITFVINAVNSEKSMYTLAENIINKYEQVKGVCANFNNKRTNVITGEKTITLTGNAYIIEELGGRKYKISAGSFFQVNPYCAELIFNKVYELVENQVKNAVILDAYSGVSSFGVWLSPIASKIVSVEEVKSASDDAFENLKLNNINNIEIINSDAAIAFNNMLKKGVHFDISLTDPPRKGCSTESAQALCELTSKYIIYVSCNVSTLARDMNIFEQYGFTPVYIQPADMFPNTPHIETIVMFKKQ